MKKYIFLLIMLYNLSLYAQETEKKTDLKIGIGTSLFGMGDMLCLNIENELNYKINKYLATSTSILFGHSKWQEDKRASFINGNINAFFSPFKNTKSNNFKIGTGISAISLASTTLNYRREINGVVVESNYQLNNRSSFGYNIIIEDELKFNEKFLIGIKIYMQDYSNGDSNGGITFKFGLKI